MGKEMRTRLFTSNYNALLAIALGGHINQPKLVPLQAGWSF